MSTTIFLDSCFVISLIRNDCSNDLFAKKLIGNSDNCCLICHATAYDAVLNIFRTDVNTAPYDEIFLSVSDKQISFIIEITDISGEEKAIAES